MFKSNIQPYPGLRPFTEDEAIFFKGRDKQIKEIIKQLEVKKFVMVTGASGDGKSSIVYAGIIPNIRAGFFKADYNNWRFAELKPEKAPMANLANALSKSLNIDLNIVSEKLKFGFSAIIDLYKSSEFYLDKKSQDWKNGSVEDKKALKKKAANLFILFDQFEEFFTNTENYNNGKPSEESQVVVNLIIETAKIALEEKLPIFIIITMRSDFIGQCASFRGLPEYIGFSEFFIPRLKRKEIVKVIQEPAILSGIKISQRLIEVLINELHDGFDQLPVLQHALSQIWKLANEEKSEMDFIHLAKIGGLKKDYLPDEDKIIFENWYNNIINDDKVYVNDFIAIFKKPSLGNVLNAHANELYLTAYDEFIKDYPEQKDNITVEQSRFIIQTVFQSLTKIDGGRLVRYRMTLQEITNIINLPNIDYKIVGGLIKIFREQGNTFIYPFINPEDSSTKRLSPDTVLDITHESLIRNWTRLKDWTNEEYINRTNYLDFEKQFGRWVNNNKKRGFLLPIGPLTFFEDWYIKAKPNKYWLTKYDERKIEKDIKLKEADENLNNALRFIKKSANKLIITRTFMKYGAGKIATIAGLIALFISITYFSFDYISKTNKYVFNDVQEKGLELLNSKKINAETKADFIINYERLHPNKYKELLSQMPDTIAYDVSFEMFKETANFNSVTDSINPLVMPVFYYMDSVLTGILRKGIKDKKVSDNDLKRINNFILRSLYVSSNSDINIDKLIKEKVDGLYQIVNNKLQQKTDSIKDVKSFNFSLEILAVSLKDKKKINNIISLITPFDANNNDSLFFKYYTKNKRIKINYRLNLTHNAGYHVLSELYGVVGNFEKINYCLDSIIKYNPDYRNQNSMVFLINNGYFSTDSFNLLVNRYAKINIKPVFDIYKQLNRVTYNNKFNLYYLNQKDRDYNYLPISIFTPDKEKEKIWDKFLSLSKEKSKNINYDLAIYYKKRGFYSYNILHDTIKAYNDFNQAFTYYSKINKDTLEKEIVIGEWEKKNIKRKLIFLYPKIIWEDDSWNIWDIYSWSGESVDNRKKDGMLEFIMNKPKYQKYYSNDDDVLKKIEYFYYSYYNTNKREFLIFKEDNWFNYKYLDFAKLLLDENNYKYDSTFYQLIDFEKQIIAKDTAKAFKIYNRIDKAILLSEDFQNAEHPKDEVHKKILRRTAKYLALNGKLDASMDIIYAMKDKYQQRNTLIDICYYLQEQGPVENTFIYLDSLYSSIDINNKYGQKLFRAMGKIGSSNIIDLANSTIKNTNDVKKPQSYKNLIRGILEADNYYLAYTQIPNSISLQTELQYYTEFLHSEVLKKDIIENGWERIDDRYFISSWFNYDFETNESGSFFVRIN